MPSRKSDRELAALAYRRAMGRRNRRVLRELLARWRRAEHRLEVKLANVAHKIAQARARGEIVNVSWLYTEARLTLILTELDAEVAAYAAAVQDAIREGRLGAAQLALDHAESLVAMGMGQAPTGVTLAQVWNGVNPAAINAMAASLTNGAPLAGLMAGLGGSLAVQAQDVLIDAVVQGRNPREVVAELRRLLGIPRSQAMTLARTEILGAYRQATSLSYKANSDVVESWVWHAEIGGCCGACLAMHGTVHDVADPMSPHPNCRCAMVPKTRSWADLGFEGIDEGDLLDVERMMRDADAQLAGAGFSELAARFGPGKAKAILDGTLTRSDLVTRHWSNVWGSSVREATLGEAVQNAARRG